MQWPTTVLVFPLFPKLLGLTGIKKRAPPYLLVIASSERYTIITPCIFPPSSVARFSRGFAANGAKYCRYLGKAHTI
jgi:hypothetical protein